jgi:hypothetical protein
MKQIIKSERQRPSNRATRCIVSALGLLIGIGGLDHGFFELLQGNTLTGGLLINAIKAGSSWTIWKEGGEGAFTVLPTFLLAGIISMLIAVSIIIWSIGFIQRKHGSLVFLILCILLFLSGGGIAQVLFFTITFGFSTRINKPLNWWRKVLPVGFRPILGKIWPGTLPAFMLLFLRALEMAVIGWFPGIKDPRTILYTCWSILGGVIMLIFISFISGFAYDMERQG